MRRGHCACEVRGPARGPARPYSCFVLERRNSGIMLPKLYIMPLDELLGIFHRGLIVRAHKSNCSADKTAFVHDVSSILGHIGVTPKSLRTTSIPSRLSGSGFRNPDVRTRRSQGAHRAASRKKVRPRISPRPYPIGTGYIRPCLQFLHCVTLIAAVNEWPLQTVVAGWSMKHRQTLA